MLEAVFNYILNLGAAVFLPILMFLLGLIVGLRPARALSAGLTLGVAFLGMSIVMEFMFNSIGPASSALVENTGIKLTAIDLGWTPTAAIAWAWPYAFLMFPLQIAINLVMLALGWTKCLNVDLWNVWNKVLTGVLVAGISGSVTAAFIVAAIEVVLELKQADISQKQIHLVTGIPGIALPHCLFFTSVLMVPLNRLLDFIPGINKVRLSPDTLREKLGIFGENHVLGFIVGILIAIGAGYDLKGILTLGIQAGTALTLFPMVAGLFMTALTPISEATTEFMRRRFPGREFYIGLDWPFLGGLNSIWVAAIVMVPFMLLLAVILPGNIALPFGGILHICATITAAVVTRNDAFRTFLLTLILTPVWLWVGSAFAPIITDLARAVGTIEIPPDVKYITWATLEAPEFRYVMSQAAAMFTKGQLWPGILLLPALAILYVIYYRMMLQREKEAAAELGLEPSGD